MPSLKAGRTAPFFGIFLKCSRFYRTVKQMGIMAFLTKIILYAFRVESNNKNVLRHLFENNYIVRIKREQQ